MVEKAGGRTSTLKGKRHTPEQIVRILRDAEADHAAGCIRQQVQLVV
jgi:hypothetical protein